MIFVLDIGTRSIVGLLGKQQGEKILVQHAVMEFHKKRVMYDGQIHDIEGVMGIIKKVKDRLEEKSGFPLKEVSIAAAGRTLKTFQTVIERDLDEYKEIDRDLVNSVKIEGIQEAQRILEENNNEITNYFCVGHTVINYYLDDGLITSPVGHRGRKLKLEVLATFLPKVVVDSLYVVMSKIGLEIAYLTLEPIAAIEVAVPENMRLLNIALVDIGAGTSDIAITKEGTVTAYGMTSTAGDEITEELARAYLLDFDKAEKIKCNLCMEKIQRFIDIVGTSHEVKSEEILDRIQPAIELVGKGIAKNILKQNGKSPSVVFLIGGGSQIPRLNTLIANYLDLPEERVVIRGMEMIQNLEWNTSFIKGPEGITPVGILVKSLKDKFSDFIELEVNHNKIKMLKTKELKVSDALAFVDFNPRELIPKKGDNLRIYLNNKVKIFFGEYGEAAKVLVNGKNANLDTLVEDGDIITISPATTGKPAMVRLEEVLDLRKSFLVNGKVFYAYHDLKVQGEEAPRNYVLQEGDRVEYTPVNTIKDLCILNNVIFEENDIYVDGEKTDLYRSLEGVKQIIIKKKEEEIEEKQDTEEEKTIEVIYNGKPLKITTSKENLVFVDIFDFIDFDRTRVQGKLVLKHNDQLANYTEPLKEGDEIWVCWE